MATDERIIIPRERVVDEYNGKTYYDDDLILAQFLLDGIAFVNNGKMLIPCNDVFAWAFADCEEVSRDELPALYERHMADPRWGHLHWVIEKRGERPQEPMVRLMKERGAWKEEYETSLRPNTTDAETQALFAHAAAQQRGARDAH